MFSTAYLAAVAAALPYPWFRGLDVTPAALPPAPGYALLPPARDRWPGNAAPSFYRALLALPKPHPDPAIRESESQQRREWIGRRGHELPRDEVEPYLKGFRTALRELDRAAAAERCEWDMMPRVAAEGLSFDFPEMGPAQVLTEAWWLRTGLEVADGRFADAAASLRTGLQTARNLGSMPGHHPLLLGLAVQTWASQRIEEWVAHPGSPNLYAALSALPRPLTNPRPAFDGESAQIDAILPAVAGPNPFPAGEAEAAKILDAVMATLRRHVYLQDAPFPESHRDPAASPDDLRAILAQHPGSREELIASGRSAAEIDRTDPVRVVVWAAVERHRALRADFAKWAGVPYHQAAPHLAELRSRAKAEFERSVHTDFTLSAGSVGGCERMRYHIATTDRRVQLLRTVEAIRLHAAAHGSPPAALADIAVPVPDDPLTGKPFGYRVRPRAVVLTAPPTDGEPPSVHNAMGYELRFPPGR